MNIFRGICWVFLVAMIQGGYAADWYVSPSGSNANPGTEALPLQTIAHALSASANGDRILLQRGATFRESGLAVNGRTLTAYGSGALPVITASTAVPVSEIWSLNTDVRTATVTSKVLACWVNGRFVPLARYPNSGWLTCDSGTTSNRLVDGYISGVAAGRWAGAQIRWRRWTWYYEVRPIVSHNDGVLNLDTASRTREDNTGIGSSYFIDNDLDELDAPGEWFWGDDTLYLYPPADVDPATMTVEVVTTTSGITCSGSTLDGIALRRFGGTALGINGTSTVRNCVFEELDTNAIDLSWNAGGTQITGNTFRDVRNVGITWIENPGGPGGSVIERNQFERIGVQRGYGASGLYRVSGIIVHNAKALTIRLNRFTDIGYAGVLLNAPGQTASRNIFVRAMSTLNDGGAIYTNCNASILRENIILDTLGDLSTSQPWYPLSHGIWPEFLSDFKDSQITDNTVYGSNGHGIFLPNNFTCTVTGNTCMDNRLAGLHLAGDSGDDQRHDISRNTLAAVSPQRRLVRTEKIPSDWPGGVIETCLSFEPGVDYGTVSGNAFIASATGAVPIRREGNGAADYADLASWASAHASWAVASDRLVRKNSIILINDTETTASMPVPSGAWTLPDGSAVGATVSVNPFRSVVLVTDGAVAADVPYRLASGLDHRATAPSDVGGGSTSDPVSLPGPGYGSAGGPGNPVVSAGGGGGGGGGCGSGGGSASALALLAATFAFGFRRRRD